MYNTPWHGPEYKGRLRVGGIKVSIEPGKLADFVILSVNPMTIESDKVLDIKVVETIKEEETIYQAK